MNYVKNIVFGIIIVVSFTISSSTMAGNTLSGVEIKKLIEEHYHINND